MRAPCFDCILHTAAYHLQEQDGCFRSPKGQQFRVGETLRNLAIRAVDLEKAESKNSAKAFGGKVTSAVRCEL